MKPYRRLAIALVVPLLLALGVRRAQIAATPAELQPKRIAGSTTTTTRFAQAPAAQAPGSAQGGERGTPGPTTELLRLLAVDRPDFGIKVVQTFNASGKPAYETSQGLPSCDRTSACAASTFFCATMTSFSATTPGVADAAFRRS